MTYQQTLEYLYKELPMFQRVGAIAYKRDLKNTWKLCEALGNPQNKFKSIHVAGTNGKGSSSHMIAAILQSEGYKTGLYTSPHLKEFTERIRINGAEVSKDYVVDFVEKVKPLIEEIKPSFFEITVAMAFDYFALEQVDFAVIEVGLGGRLDSTNVINPLVSLITNIGFDHKDLLGDTLEAIAKEKAGIIKPHTPIVISERQNEIVHVFVEKARAMQSPIHFAQDSYKVQFVKDGGGMLEIKKNEEIHFEQLTSELTGSYQKKNITGVLSVIDALIDMNYAISRESIMQGLANTIKLTGLKGRWQKLGDFPLIYCDTGHNAEGITEVLQIIDTLSFSKLHFVIGMVKDKDHAAVLSLLPKNATYYFCQAKIPRALDAAQLGIYASRFGLKGIVCGEVKEGIRQAKVAAQKSDLIFIGGSTFVVAEIEEL